MNKKSIFFASTNKSKIIEIERLFLNNNNNNVVFQNTPIEAKVPECLEPFETFEENSIAKAFHYYHYLNRYFDNKEPRAFISDDSGICVHALNNRPGVYSHRYADSPQQRIEKLLNELQHLKYGTERTAHFISVITYIDTDGNFRTFKGRLDGYITLEPIGDFGFDYDCVFIPLNYNTLEYSKKTLAQISTEEKNKISHRAIALQKMFNFVNEF